MMDHVNPVSECPLTEVAEVQNKDTEVKVSSLPDNAEPMVIDDAARLCQIREEEN